MIIAIQEPIAVANFIIEIANENKKSITNLKLQKIMFFLQGYCLTRYGEPIINGNFSKWKYGPVQVSVYDEFKIYASGPIAHLSSKIVKKDNKFEFVCEKLNLADKSIESELTAVVKKIMKKKPWELVDITHNHSSWKNFRSDIMNHEAIDYSYEEIESCYKDNVDLLGLQ